MIDLKSITVGTDAELPLFLPDDTPFPVTGLVGGTKVKPRPLGKLGAGFAVQEDNVNLEFNIPPARSDTVFVNSIAKALKQIKQELPPTVRFNFRDHTVYKPEFLNHPAAKEFGCDPDFNVYTKTVNPRPKAANENLRTAAAHVHVGWPDPTNEDRAALVKWLDVYLGIYFGTADSRERRELYGKAGSYRPKEYGVEYRVLGNRWLVEDGPSSVWHFVNEAARRVNDGAVLSPEQESGVIEYINTGVVTKYTETVMEKYAVWPM
jgi:hypothetical protein